MSNIVLAIGLVALAGASGVVTVFAAWAVLGVGMALGLHDAGFATLAALYGRAARGPITGITLFAGFASTVSWPLSALLNDTLGWRETCLIWAVLNLVMGLPLNRLVLPAVAGRAHAQLAHAASIGWKPYREMFLLAFVFAAAWFVTGAMAAHLPGLLERAGATPLEAVAAAALVGPAQVAARLVEFFVLHRAHPLMSARIAAALHPIGVGIFALTGLSGAAVFVVLYGAGNGLLTIARGTVPLALFGPLWLWRTHRPPGRASPRRPGVCAAAVRASARRRGRVGPVCLGRPLPSPALFGAILFTGQAVGMNTATYHRESRGVPTTVPARSRENLKSKNARDVRYGS